MTEPFFPPGHYHSPIVDPSQVNQYVAKARAVSLENLKGITISKQALTDRWAAMTPAIATTKFAQNKTAQHRYFECGSPYPYADAMTLRAMVISERPRRIIEIGSGFSTACMLDTLDEFNLSDCRITCIEPYPERLLGLIREEDHSRLDIIRSGVQSVDVSIFEELGKSDILFIDSTHVLKTGSDVHFEIFEVLPIIEPGVLIHFHDCPYPFEYPNEWIFEKNYSWNEAYALRAFLMYNSQFSVLFWNSLFRRIFPDLWIASTPQAVGKNPGTSIWLKRQ
jgi:predicted O-methyltransferase YrrM